MDLCEFSWLLDHIGAGPFGLLLLDHGLAFAAFAFAVAGWKGFHP
jgi:hypothetical protein